MLRHLYIVSLGPRSSLYQSTCKGSDTQNTTYTNKRHKDIDAQTLRHTHTNKQASKQESKQASKQTNKASKQTNKSRAQPHKHASRVTQVRKCTNTQTYNNYPTSSIPLSFVFVSPYHVQSIVAVLDITRALRRFNVNQRCLYTTPVGNWVGHHGFEVLTSPFEAHQPLC